MKDVNVAEDGRAVHWRLSESAQLQCEVLGRHRRMQRLQTDTCKSLAVEVLRGGQGADTPPRP